MKNTFLILFLFVCSIVQAQIIDIPDANFKNTLVSVNCADLDGDGIIDNDVDTNDDLEIQVSEAEAAFGIYVQNKNIFSLEGIEAFINLETLNCSVNQINSLDVTQMPNLLRLECYNNLISSLDISQNSNLEILNCSDNILSILDVSQNNNLTSLYFSGNNISNIDISQNTQLLALSCYINKLTNLDVSTNHELVIIDCQNNQINTLNITQNPKLEGLWSTNNDLTNLNLSNNPVLEQLYLSNNSLVNLDISQNPDLVYLGCQLNELNNLNLKNGNNEILDYMNAAANPNLNCIQVDDVNYAENAPNWAKDSSAQYSEVCILGVQNNEFNDFTLTPNPTQDILNINSGNQIEAIKIFSLQGEPLIRTSYTNINVSHLNSGLYFVKVSASGKTSTKKFVKI